MSATRDLATLLRNMAPVLAPSTYVFCCIAGECLPPGVNAVCQFREAEGLTVIIEQSDAERFGVDYGFVARMITLNVHSDLAAVGFLSTISTTLAQAGIACNVVSAYHHDHLFIPPSRVEDALGLLRSLAASFAIS